MTREEAQQFKARWKLVNEFVVEEARRTPPGIKLQQLALMYKVGQILGWDDEREIRENEVVRERWRRLKEKSLS